MATTEYGTAPLPSASQGQSQARRRAAIKWGLLVAAASGLCGAVAFHELSRSAPTDVAATAAPPVSETSTAAELFCVQSSFVDGEARMVEPVAGLEWSARAPASDSTISVDVERQYQEIFGFGGAFTEAAALQFNKLSPELQEQVLTLYFDKEHGNAYEFGRVPMGSCDFSVASYSFDDVHNDSSLEHFDTDVEHDTKLLIPFIQRALQRNPALKMFLAPWSPPAWMKRPATDYVPSMLGSADPIGLRDDVRETWANYFSKFITAYKQHGINFWGLTPQNEPQFDAPWEACMYSATFQAEFVGHFLGPVLERDHPEVKIMVFDHNRGSVFQWADEIFNHPAASQYVDGIAFHWYDGERYMDGVENHDRLNDTHFVDEKRFMLATESCNCPGVAHGDAAWFRAQRYAHDIISDFNNWVSGWVDWNLLLDHTGGPNHLGNNCDAPIIIDETEKSYFIQPMYYFIQHFSKYVPPGSKRVHTDVQVKYKQPGDAQLFVFYPSALHSCDWSSRQNLRRTEDNKIEVSGTGFCLDVKVDEWVGRQVELVECRYTQQTWTFEASGQIRMDDACLALNHGSTDSGARIMAAPCVSGDEGAVQRQSWQFVNGTLQSLASDKCVTAGYPFAQAAAFVTPEDKKVLVVLNENTEPAEFDIAVGGRSVSTSVPSGGIRTFVWE